MRDLATPRWMVLKAVLLLGAGLLASALLIADRPTVTTAALVAVAVWAFARFYYFCFYVIERYIDPTFRFSGVGSAVRFLLKGRPPA